MCAALAVMLIAATCMWGVVEAVQGDGSHTVGYEDLLFDQGRVHTIDITMAEWDAFIENATAEEYTECNITVDGEKYNNVAIRAKGNTSLSSVATLNSTRYSFKVEFDHYVDGMTYHGLDKLSLNNMIQDATMMKDYLAYTLMNRMGVPSSLCSYVQVTVNGEDWGLYLAVEGIEDGFLERNGMTRGELYKPDSLSFGGGRGNGRDFDIEKFRMEEDETEAANGADTEEPQAETGSQAGQSGFGGNFQMPSGMGGFSGFGGNMTPPDSSGFTMPGSTDGSSFPSGGMPDMSGFSMPDESAFLMPGSSDQDGAFSFGSMGGFGGFNFGMGSDDVKLVYTDDDPDSYSNIFNNAKTDVSKKDKTRLIQSLKKLNAKEDLDDTVDKSKVITYLAVHNFLCNDDSYTGMMVHNYYLYEENGKLSILPWDYNLAFGGFSAGSNATSTVNSPIDSPVSSGTTESRPLIAWIFSDGEALEAYHSEYDRFLSENIENGWLASEISRVKEMITPYLEKDASAFYGMDEFEKAVDTLLTFCEKRAQSIRGQLEGTVPSTSNGQRNSSALIDASEISTGDMGSMSGGGGIGGMKMPSSRPESGSSGRISEGASDGRSGGPSMPSGFSGGMSGSFGGFSGGFPGQSGQTPPTAPDGATGSVSAENAAPSSDTAGAPKQGEAKPDDPPEGDGGRDTGTRRASMPGGFSGNFAPQRSNTSNWVILAACLGVLLLALGLTKVFRNHND